MMPGSPISEQLAMFFRSVLLGGSLALVYDLFRSVRGLVCASRRKGPDLAGRLFRGLLDVAYCLTAVSSVFFFIMAGDGELRVFILLGILGGAVLFFCLLSQLLRPLWDAWLGLLLTPVRILWKVLKKLFQICKKLFSFLTTWFTIIGRHSSGLWKGRRRKADEDSGQGGKSGKETSQQ